MNALVIMPEMDISRTVVSALLEGTGFTVASTEADELSTILERREYHLALVGLPGEELRLCRDVRESSPDIALICLSTAALIERIAMLEAGADDVILRPFEPAEFLARAKALMARSGRSLTLGRKIAVGRLTLDRDRSCVHLPWKQEVYLTPTERRMLDHLITRPGATITREALLTAIWGSGQESESNPVDIYIRRLRIKLEKDPARPELIVTVRGFGYRFNP